MNKMILQYLMFEKMEGVIVSNPGNRGGEQKDIFQKFEWFWVKQPECSYNSIRALGVLAILPTKWSLPFSWRTQRGKHWWHPIAVMGV